VALLPYLAFQFCFPKPQHAVQFRRVDAVGQQRADLVQAEAESLEGDQAVEDGQLRNVVRAAACVRVDVGRDQ
jgi:hypothetical protein